MPHKKSVRAPNAAPSRIAIRDTWNSEMLAAIQPETSAIQIYKNRLSGFYATDLDSTLKRVGARS